MRTLRTLAAAFAALLILAPAGPAAADDGTLTLGVGALPAQTLFELFSDVTLAAISFGTIEPSTETEHPAVYLEYAACRGERTRLLLHANVAGYEKNYRLADKDDAIARVSDDFYTVMGGVSRDWIHGESFAAYVGFMLGATFVSSSSDMDEVETENSVLAAWQVTPLGLRFGRGFVVDLAVGVGHKGLVSAGAGFAF